MLKELEDFLTQKGFYKDPNIYGAVYRSVYRSRVYTCMELSLFNRDCFNLYLYDKNWNFIKLGFSREYTPITKENVAYLEKYFPLPDITKSSNDFCDWGQITGEEKEDEFSIICIEKAIYKVEYPLDRVFYLCENHQKGLVS